MTLLAAWLSTAFDVLGVVGALATAAALVWSVYTWRHRRGAHLKVTTQNVMPVMGEELEWCFGVTAINRSDHPVKVTSAGLIMPDGRDLVIVRPPFPGALPTEVARHDSAQTWIDCRDLEAEGFDLYGTVTGWVRTSTDERFESKPTVLRSP